MEPMEDSIGSTATSDETLKQKNPVLRAGKMGRFCAVYGFSDLLVSVRAISMLCSNIKNEISTGLHFLQLHRSEDQA